MHDSIINSAVNRMFRRGMEMELQSLPLRSPVIVRKEQFASRVLHLQLGSIQTDTSIFKIFEFCVDYKFALTMDFICLNIYWALSCCYSIKIIEATVKILLLAMLTIICTRVSNPNRTQLPTQTKS